MVLLALYVHQCRQGKWKFYFRLFPLGILWRDTEKDFIVEFFFHSVLIIYRQSLVLSINSIATHWMPTVQIALTRGAETVRQAACTQETHSLAAHPSLDYCGLLFILALLKCPLKVNCRWHHRMCGLEKNQHCGDWVCWKHSL